MADGAVSSARGNSGIILSQVLVGLADTADVLTADHDATFQSSLLVRGCGWPRGERYGRSAAPT